MIEIIIVFIINPGRRGNHCFVVLFIIWPVKKRGVGCKGNDILKFGNGCEILELIDGFSAIILALNTHTRNE